MNMKEAIRKIEELEKENSQLRLELQEYKNRKISGRKKHDEKWMSSYQSWVQMYESGMTVMEIMEQSEISRRTFYRYKAYYEELNNSSGSGI